MRAKHVTGGGKVSCLQNWTWQRISCCLMWDARCCNRQGLSMIGEQHKRDGNWVRQNNVQLKQMAMECVRIKVQKNKREVYWVAKINREVECLVIERMGEYLRITPESFSNYLYIYSKTNIVQQRMYLGLKGKWEWNQSKFLSKNKPVEILSLSPECRATFKN